MRSRPPDCERSSCVFGETRPGTSEITSLPSSNVALYPKRTPSDPLNANKALPSATRRTPREGLRRQVQAPNSAAGHQRNGVINKR